MMFWYFLNKFDWWKPVLDCFFCSLPRKWPPSNIQNISTYTALVLSIFKTFKTFCHLCLWHKEPLIQRFFSKYSIKDPLDQKRWPKKYVSTTYFNNVILKILQNFRKLIHAYEYRATLCSQFTWFLFICFSIYTKVLNCKKDPFTEHR